MNCDCVTKFEKKIIGIEWKNKKILSASLQGMLVFERKAQMFTSSSLTVTLEGRKGKVDIEVKHTYCPFCGKKTDDDSSG